MTSPVNLSEPLPIDEAMPRLKQALAGYNRCVLQAPPGAGKTTRVPLALLDEPWLAGRRILILEPRRLAARAAAARMAAELGETPGGTVGYRIRFESRVGRGTRIEVITEGILTRRLQDDPELTGVGAVLFDEFHERHLHGDLALALCREAQGALREDLRLLLMSATLDAEALARELDAPVVTSEGRSYPVDVHYLPRDPEGPLPAPVVAGVRRALHEQSGDVLVFLPGSGEIRRVAEALEAEPGLAGVGVHPLFGDLPLERQQAAIEPDPTGRRKVVLATNIAETSLTIEGIGAVVDSGWMRTPRFDPRSALTRLETVRVSRASADQRAGRAGRLGPGICYRLWSEATDRGLLARQRPEIGEADLASLALELAVWGTEATELAWVDPPPAGALAQARELLYALEALDGAGRVTPAGRAMAALPAHPRIAHMLLGARERGTAELAADVAALLGERDVLRQREDGGDDFALRVEALRAMRRRGAGAARALGADPGACRAVERAARQWRRLLGAAADDGAAAPEELARLLVLAYPDRVAAAREPGGARLLLAGGRGARLPEHSGLRGRPLLAVAAVEDRGTEALVRSGVPLDLEVLEATLPDACRWEEDVSWDSREQAVRAQRVYRFGRLTLAGRALDRPDPERTGAAMIEGVRQLGLEALPWSDAARQLVARVESLRSWFPEQEWPDLSDAALAGHLDQWLAPYLGGISRRGHLGRLDLVAILRDRVGWNRLPRLDEGAPTHLEVPSGRRVALVYTPGEPPVFAVKLQEMFGATETPSVGWGRVPVQLHLLSPAQRPLHITQDLRGFWDGAYREVRKEMRGRYPKHPWPDDPWSAPPTAATKRRM